MITPFLIVLNHFFADFFCQTDKMAVNKSKSMKWLTIHAIAYTIAMTPLTLYIKYSLGATWIDALCWLVLNGMLHWITDFFTSKWTSYLYQKSVSDPDGIFIGGSWRHWFFTVIGFDQIIHYFCLFFTYQWLAS